MDVYENAKSHRKDRVKGRWPFKTNRKDSQDQKERLLELFSSEVEHDLSVKYWGNARSRRQSETSDTDGTAANTAPEKGGISRRKRDTSLAFTTATTSKSIPSLRSKRLVSYITFNCCQIEGDAFFLRSFTGSAQGNKKTVDSPFFTYLRQLGRGSYNFLCRYRRLL